MYPYGYAGGGIYTMPHFAQMAGGGIYTIPMAGGGMYVPGYGLGGFFRGLSKVASVASMIPGPHQAFTIPIAAGSGAIGGAMDGGGLKGGLKGGVQGFVGAKAGQSLTGGGDIAKAATTLSGALSGGDEAAPEERAEEAASFSAGPASSRRVVPSNATESEAQGYAEIEGFNGGGSYDPNFNEGAETSEDIYASLFGQDDKGGESLSTLDKILNVAQHPAMMALGYPLLGQLLGGVGKDSLGRMGPARSTTGEPIQRVMPSYVTDRQGDAVRAQGYAEIPGRRRGGMIGEEERPSRRSSRRTSRRKPAPKRRPPPVMPQPFIPPPVVAQPFVPPQITPQPVRPQPVKPQPEVRPQPTLPPPPAAPRAPRKMSPERERPVDIPTTPQEKTERRETSTVENRFEELERQLAPSEDRRSRRAREGEGEGRVEAIEGGGERREERRSRDSRRRNEEAGELGGERAETTGGAEDTGRGTSYEEGRYRYGDRMTEEQELMAERFETQDEFGGADESADIENIRAIAKGTPADDIVSVDGGFVENTSEYDPTPTSLPGIQNPELLAQRDAELMANPVTYQRPTTTTVGPPTGQFRPQAHEITDIPEWYRAGLMSEQALETGQPETFQGQDPFSVFAGQPSGQDANIPMPHSANSLQVPNMPFLQQGPPQMGPPPPIVDPGDKFSRPRIEAPRRAVPAEQQMQPPMQMPQPVQPSPDFMPQPVLEGRADGGMTPQDIPFEGFIEPFEDGTMESSGAVDDRVAVMKPNLSEVGPEQMEMLLALKNALRNPDSAVAREIIELARNTFGEEFIINLMDDMLSAGNNSMVESQDDMDRLVEMEFRENLAEGGPVRVGAAIAPNEYVLTASQVRNVGGGSTEEGARRIKKLARDIDIAGSKTDRPLNVEIA